MSQPIKDKRVDLVGAGTPQNTPSTTAPISSHASAPKVSTIEEGDSEKVRLIQGKLNTLIGRPSGYVEPAEVTRRLTGLQGIQKEHTKLEAQFQEEVLELEKKYFAKFQPLYNRRSDIVNGIAEPTDAEVKAGTVQDPEEPKDAKDDEVGEKSDIKGIPEFWLTAMRKSPSITATITDRDEKALKHLTDIQMSYLDRPGFRLHFLFEENEFFTNKEITKTYYYQEESGYGGDFIYDHAEGDKIDWKAGKDLTVRVESKKQRNKNTKQTRVVKRTVPTESFFNFFSPPTPPTGEEEDDDASSDIEDRLELDYQLGEDIKEKLIQRAVDWYTGDALQYEELEDDLGEADFDDEDEDDFSDEDRDDDDEDEESEDEDDNSKPKQETAECKQS